MIKAVIFDCFGVLTTDWWREFTASLPEGEGKQTAKELNHQYDAGLISLEEFAKGVEQATGRKPQIVEDIFSTPEPVKNTELLSYIKQLKKTYKIGMISNVGTNWITEHFLTAEEQALFDQMILSYEVGYTKPDPKIYQIALQRLGVQPNEAVFIDDIITYCEAAKAVGMGAVNYLDFQQMKKELESLLAASTN